MKRPPEKVCHRLPLKFRSSEISFVEHDLTVISNVFYFIFFIGGKISGPALGTWNIPAVIADEEFYRSNASNSNISLVPPNSKSN